MNNMSRRKWRWFGKQLVLLSRRNGGDSVNSWSFCHEGMVVIRSTTSPKDELFTESPLFLNDIFFTSSKHRYIFCLLHTLINGVILFLLLLKLKLKTVQTGIILSRVRLPDVIWLVHVMSCDTFMCVHLQRVTLHDVKTNHGYLHFDRTYATLL